VCVYYEDLVLDALELLLDDAISCSQGVYGQRKWRCVLKVSDHNTVFQLASLAHVVRNVKHCEAKCLHDDFIIRNTGPNNLTRSYDTNSTAVLVSAEDCKKAAFEQTHMRLVELNRQSLSSPGYDDQAVLERLLVVPVAAIKDSKRFLLRPPIRKFEFLLVEIFLEQSQMVFFFLRELLLIKMDSLPA